MKLSIILSLCALLGMSSNVFAADCSNLKACERKYCEIESQLSIAKSQGNEFKVDGLNKALAAAKENCTLEALHDDIEDEINDAAEDIEEYESDLQDAKSANKMDKIEKYQRKIAEQQQKIARLNIELAELE